MATIFNATTTSSVFGTSQTYTIPAVTDGRSVIYAFSLGNTFTITAVTLGGISGTSITSLTGSAGGNNGYWYRWDNVTGSPTTVVLTYSGGSTFPDPAIILECSALGTATIGSAASGGSASVVTASVTTTDNNSLIVGQFLTVGETLVSSGYTTVPSSGSSFNWVVWNPTPGAAGTYSPNFQASSSNNWDGKLVGFAAAGNYFIAWIKA